MISRSFLFASLVSIISLSTVAQNKSDEWQQDQTADSSRFFYGFNVGAYFPNHNTAEIYSGSPAVTPYGIEYILNQPQFQQRFDDYFQAPREVVEYPIESKYRTTAELGFHLGYHLTHAIDLFLDFNIAQLDYEQFFTIAVYDPNNQRPGPTLLRFPIIGEENRFMLNLGTQFNFFKGETSDAYFMLAGNINNTNLQDNYIVIDQTEYGIFHYNPNTANQRPGGVGYGAAAGVGFKFLFSQNIWADIHYHTTYMETNMTERLQPYGFQHSLGIRVIWD